MEVKKADFNDNRPYSDDARHAADREIEQSASTLMQQVAKDFIDHTEQESANVAICFGDANCVLTTPQNVYFVFGYCLPRHHTRPEINERVEKNAQAIISNFERALRNDPDNSEGGRLLKALGIDTNGRHVRVFSISYDLETRHAHVKTMLADDDDFLAQVDAETLNDASDTYVPDPLETL